ncbi:MAG: spore cortex biosynthesis protein YabQ [Anaerotignaceae bacterium]
MILSLNLQAKTFIITVLCGMALGFFYDWIRVFRYAVAHKKFFIHLEDGLYWIFAVIALFIIMLNTTLGEIRFFSVMGTFLGMLLYFLIVSTYFLMVSEAIVRLIKKIISIFFEIVLTPIRLILKIMGKIFGKTVGFAKKKSKKPLHLCKLCVKIYRQRFIGAVRIMLKKYR